MMQIRLIGLVFAATAMLSGCATTRGLKPEQCHSANWQAVGYQDGLMGRDANFLTHHRDRCAKVNVTPNQPQWEQGRQQGLQRYCTPLRAYQLGREGIAYNNVCPADQTLELLKAHDEGNYYYQLNERFNEFNRGYDPFWGDGWWGTPFYGGYRGLNDFYRFGSLPTPRPRVIPDYVPSTAPTTLPPGTAPTTKTADANK